MVNCALRLGQLARLATTGSNHGSPATTSVPIEVHEYGWASWGKFNDQSFWPRGAFGGSYCVSAWLWLRSAGMGSMVHWGYGFNYSLATANPAAAGAVPGVHVGRPLISGCGWVLAAMRQLLGPGEDSSSGSSVIGAHAVRDSPSQRNPAVNTTLGAFRTAQPQTKTLQYLIVAYTADYTEETEVALTLTIRAADFPRSPFWSLSDPHSVTVREMRYGKSNSVYDQIHAALSAAGGYPTMLTKNDSSVDMVSTRVVKGTEWPQHAGWLSWPRRKRRSGT